MHAKVLSVGLKGMEGYRVQVEVHIVADKPSMVIVGLPDASVKESKERVLAALHFLKCQLSDKKIVVNLSPPEQKKNGPMFDLAMAIGILKALNHFPQPIPSDTAFLGALSLDGSLQVIDGLLPAVLAAKAQGVKRIFLPFDPLLPIHQIHDIECIPATTLHDVIQMLKGEKQTTLDFPSDSHHPILLQKQLTYPNDFQNIYGHQQAKRALEIAAAGAHHVLMTGPPGCGKSLLAETFPSILPALTTEAQLEMMSLYQLAHASPPAFHFPPFRQPHHSASSVSIVGGGSYPKPGEVSLAHRGVLFLDEMAEFTKKTLDMLRQPLQSGNITISRTHSTVTYPARFILIGAMNPCPCGHLYSRTHYCTCTDKQIQTYQNRVSGPIYDRMDILLQLQPVNLDKEANQSVETSTVIRDRIMRAREQQYKRYGQEICNGYVPYEQLLELQPLTSGQRKMLQQVSSKQHWSNRVQTKIVRLARTISDLEGEGAISDKAIWEAMSLRRTNVVEKRKGKAKWHNG